MKIQVGGLSEGVHTYEFWVPAEELELGEGFGGEVSVRAELEKTGTQFHLKASISASGEFECDRCLSRVSSRLTPSYGMHYFTDGGNHEECDPSEVQLISPGMHVIDITDDVRQTILLAIPLKVLCKNECAGLCPMCARNLNDGPCTCQENTHDTRWDQLRKLQRN